MRVCDKHPRSPAVDRLHLESTDLWMDLCDKCQAAINEWIGSTQEAVEKPKKKSFLGRKN